MDMEWLQELINFLTSTYLIQFWWFLGAQVLGCYGLAYLIAHAMGKNSNYTIIYNCRLAWGLAFLTHCVASIGITVYWFFDNGYFNDFWMFFPFYLVMIGLDIGLSITLLVSCSRYRTYQT